MSPNAIIASNNSNMKVHKEADVEMTNFSKEDTNNNSSEEKQTRNVLIRYNHSIENEEGLNNAISTTKYTLLTWLPISVWLQFRRVANAYFLGIGILMLIGTYAPYLFQSPLNPYSTLGTLAFVLLVTSVKEGYEDYQRYKSDLDENLRKITLIKQSANGFEEELVESRNIKAGDIIYLNGKMPVPADVILLMTSNYKDGNQCYVETANIDGETNLKVREAPPALSEIVLQSEGKLPLELVKGQVECEKPNKDIHKFVGALHLDTLPNIPLSAENIMLRGSLFSNTDWAYAVAVYTGRETKVQMNNTHAKLKLSKIETYLNKAILFIFIAQIIVVSMSVISLYILGFNNISKLPYINVNGEISNSILPLWLEQWFIFLLLYNNMIPISLYVTIELVNIGQSLFIISDREMYDPDLDMPCLVRASNLAQELGLISNIFSDKTGTLTRNEMKLVKFMVDGQMYDVPQSNEESIREVIPEDNAFGLEQVDSVQELISRYLKDKNENHKYRKLYEFLCCLVICHTVVRDKDGKYRAESPDELALIEGVNPFNFQLLDRGTTSMLVDLYGSKHNFNILAVNAFNADRKRMSILVVDNETEEYFMYCKGADNIMLPLCAIDAANKKQLEKSLLDLSSFGLRTLCIAQKKLTREQAMSWLDSFKLAAASIQNRDVNLAKIAADLEIDMEILGITAIEDRLQDEVPEVIADLAKAGIILWMLTGDKEETAVNIGRSCNLLLGDTKLFFLTKLDDADSYAKRLEEVYQDLVDHSIVNEEGKTLYAMNEIDQEFSSKLEMALVMDGPSFSYFNDNDPEQVKQLLAIGKACRAVVACRLTPIQKKQLVALVKNDPVAKAITLSIGDGANDVSMIREACIGVGIYGKEGRQAANNADFAIGQFKFLRRLLLLHGRWNYARQSRVFLYCMHKNLVITVTLFWFTYLSSVSGVTTYESWIYSSFNFVLGLPIVFYGMQNRDLSEKFVLANPMVYSTSKDNTFLTFQNILLWILNAMLYALVLCLLFYYAFYLSGATYPIYTFGTCVFVGMCNSLQLKVAFMMNQWTRPQCFVFILSVAGMLGFQLISSAVFDDYHGIATHLFATGMFWFYPLFSIPLFTILIDVILYYCCFFFYPDKEMLFYESEHIVSFINDILIPTSAFEMHLDGCYDINRHDSDEKRMLLLSKFSSDNPQIKNRIWTFLFSINNKLTSSSSSSSLTNQLSFDVYDNPKDRFVQETNPVLKNVQGHFLANANATRAKTEDHPIEDYDLDHDRDSDHDHDHNHDHDQDYDNVTKSSIGKQMKNMNTNSKLNEFSL